MPVSRKSSVSHKNFYLIYILGFLWSLSVALPTYIQSSFLGEFVNVNDMGLYMSAASLATLIAIFFFPKFIKRFSNYWVMLSLAGINMIIILFMITTGSKWIILFTFIIYYLSLNLLGINLDIFLENISDDAHTGHIRTTFLTIMNIAWVISPWLMGYLTGNNNYSLVFLIGALMLIPVIIILFTQKKIMIDHVHYKSRHFHKLFNIWKNNENLKNIFILSFALRLFYTIMILYVPIYLHEQFGFSWEVMGVIFTIMLLPFVMLEMPAGNLADRYLGEKEIMIIGFLIMILAVASMFFITSHSVVLWTAILFTTRVGASLVEAMQEAYFFKNVDREDMDMINMFRDLRPGAWLVGSLMSVVILNFLSIPYIFLFLAVFLVSVLRPALLLRDTK